MPTVDADPRRWAVPALAGGPAMIGDLSGGQAEAGIGASAYRLAPYAVRALT